MVYYSYKLTLLQWKIKRVSGVQLMPSLLCLMNLQIHVHAYIYTLLPTLLQLRISKMCVYIYAYVHKRIMKQVIYMHPYTNYTYSSNLMIHLHTVHLHQPLIHQDTCNLQHIHYGKCHHYYHKTEDRQDHIVGRPSQLDTLWLIWQK